MGYRGNGDDDRRFARCARCDAIVFAEPTGSCHTSADIMCLSCGTAMPDLPFVDSAYFNVVMRVGRPLGHVARLRRARKRLLHRCKEGRSRLSLRQERRALVAGHHGFFARDVRPSGRSDLAPIQPLPNFAWNPCESHYLHWNTLVFLFN